MFIEVTIKGNENAHRWRSGGGDESHRGMVDGCRWNGGGMGYSRLLAPVVIKGMKCERNI